MMMMMMMRMMRVITFAVILVMKNVVFTPTKAVVVLLRHTITITIAIALVFVLVICSYSSHSYKIMVIVTTVKSISLNCYDDGEQCVMMSMTILPGARPDHCHHRCVTGGFRTPGAHASQGRAQSGPGQ